MYVIKKDRCNWYYTPYGENRWTRDIQYVMVDRDEAINELRIVSRTYTAAGIYFIDDETGEVAHSRMLIRDIDSRDREFWRRGTLRHNGRMVDHCVTLSERDNYGSMRLADFYEVAEEMLR